MSASDEISASDYRKIVFQHSYFLLSRALDSFELGYYNLSVFFGFTAIEEITNNLYNITKMDENFDIQNFMQDILPMTEKLLKNEEVENQEIQLKLTEILEKYFVKNKIPSNLSMEELSSQFKLKEHKSHTKKTLKALIHALSINPEAYRKLGSGFIEYYLFLAERGLLFHLRNLCLYVNVERGSINSPEETIPKSMAVDMIAIAFESIIELKNLGRSYFSKEEVNLIDEMNLRKKADEFYTNNGLKPIVYVGQITDFLDKKNVIIVNILGNVAQDDDLVIYDPQWKHSDRALSIEKNHLKISKAISGDIVGIKIQGKVSRRGLLYKVQNNIGQIQKEGIIDFIDLFHASKKTGVPPDTNTLKELMDKSLRGIA